jgi:osmotically-inducible protein OsmY
MENTKKAFAVIFTCLSLSGCVGALVAGAASGGAVVNDIRSLKEMEKDTRISHDVSMTLTRHKPLKTSHIVVSSFYQMVLLAGEVPDAKLKSLAEKLTLKVPGVRRVYNQIEIGPNASLKDQAKDAWLTTKVKSSMLAKSGLHSGAIKVISEKGVVYLVGLITHEQANLAVDVARRISGVKRVVKLFKYKD